MTKGLKALEKINHTVCLAFDENNNALFNKDEYEHIDCKDIYEFIECYNDIKKELKAPTNLINKELRNARKSLPYDDYRCGYIDALITIKNKIKEQCNEK